MTHEVTTPPEEPAQEAVDPQEDVPESAEEHRGKVVAELRASGTDMRQLARPAGQVLSGWSTKVKELGADGEFGSFECFAKGCFMTVQHSSETAANRATEIITRTGEFNGWQAGKLRSGVVARPDGKVEVTWVLFPPEAGMPALPNTLPPDTLEELRQQQPGTKAQQP